MYVAVASADQAAKKAKALGGNVLMEPFDVMDVGRMAIIQDQQGAAFCVWEAKKHIGAEVANEPGALCWAELDTTTWKSAEKFYTGLFGWGVKRGGEAANETPYTEWQHGGKVDRRDDDDPEGVGTGSAELARLFRVRRRGCAAKKAGE
jgi:predicted enzyme related to lactoylglutathione lyase